MNVTEILALMVACAWTRQEATFAAVLSVIQPYVNTFRSINDIPTSFPQDLLAKIVKSSLSNVTTILVGMTPCASSSMIPMSVFVYRTFMGKSASTNTTTVFYHLYPSKTL